MYDTNFKQINEQFEKNVLGPAREVAKMGLEHVEKLASVQLEAAKAYSDMGVKQARAALDIRDQEGVKAYMENQQQFTQSFADRLKGDAEKVVALNQEFAEKAQKAVQDNVSNATQAAASAAKAK